MSFKTITIFLSLLIVSMVLAAPYEDSTAGQESSSSSAPSTSSPDQTSSTPATAGATKEVNSTDSMATGAVENMINTTTFTCYGRPIGYYADEESNCKVYHFCLLGEYNGEPVYQRISYLCLNGTVFDQQALDCLASENSQTVCNESHNHYELSNKLLRHAIVGNRHDLNQSSGQANATNLSNATTTSTTAATS